VQEKWIVDSSNRDRIIPGLESDGTPFLKLLNEAGDEIWGSSTVSKGPAVPAMIPISWLVLAIILSVLINTLFQSRLEKFQIS
jgi:hypothetical protein